MEQISPVAWVIIILLVLFIIGLNVSLVSALRSPNRPKMKMDRTTGQTAESVRKLGAVLRDPLVNERSQLNTLSEMVHHLEDSHLQDQDQKESQENLPKDTDH